MKKLTISMMMILVIVLAACGGKSEEAPSIVGATWQWQSFEDTAGVNDITVSNPASYTLTLNDDGTASIQADCNQVSWPYELNGSGLTFDSLGPSTLAACGEDSLDTQYLDLLANTATFVMSDGNLVLNLKADAGNLVFSPK